MGDCVWAVLRMCVHVDVCRCVHVRVYACVFEVQCALVSVSRFLCVRQAVEPTGECE